MPVLRLANGASTGGRGAPRVVGAEAFYDCSLTRSEAVLLLAVMAITVALQCKPVLASPAANYLLVGLACITWLSPLTGFYFIAVSQNLPFPQDSPVNPAQIGVLTWPVISLLRYHRIRLSGLWCLWPVAPFLLWFWAVSGEDIFDPTGEFAKALLYSVIACQLANEAKGQYLKCLVGLCAGGLMVASAFWAQACGLPVELQKHGTIRRGFTRLGGVRADSVGVWPPLLMGMFGLMGTAVLVCAVAKEQLTAKRLLRLSAVVFILALPPLISTMTQAAYAGFAAMTVILVLYVYVLRRRGFLPAHAVRAFATIAVCVLMVGTLLIVTNVFDVRSRSSALLDFYSETREKEGVMASRGNAWEASVTTLELYPFLGVMGNGPGVYDPIMLLPPSDQLSHNVFLDYGRYAGIPCMLLLVFFFVHPFVRMWRSPYKGRFLPFFLAYMVMFLFWMTLSYQYNKVFWGLWMLMALVAERVAWPQEAPTDRRKFPGLGLRRPRSHRLGLATSS